MVPPPILERPPVHWTEGAVAWVILVAIYSVTMVGATLAPYGG
jgi:hypothetical protein